jgi:signal transduction histidine kinase
MRVESYYNTKRSSRDAKRLKSPGPLPFFRPPKLTPISGLAMTPQILIVDDDYLIRAALSHWVASEGWTSLEAEDAHRALALLDTGTVDLALVDVRLPDMDGIELTQRIVDLNADIPIILMTAFADLETARLALTIGVYEYFTKPFDFKDLRAGIERGLQHRRLAQENRLHRSRLEQEVAERTQELTQTNAQLQAEIEERKKMEHRLVQLERLGALAEMSQGISHNLNNILTGILGPAQLIALLTKDEKVLREAEVIRISAVRATDLVKRLAVSVRGQTGQLHEVDVTNALQNAIEATRPHWKDQAEARGIQIEIEQQLQPALRVVATSEGLFNVLLNLILNAVDAMPDGGKITLTTSLREGMVEILTSDTGLGMDEETKRRIFEPFFTTKAEIGKGLGMSGVFTSIAGWGGEISLESHPGQGTTVTVRIPPFHEALPNTDAVQPVRSAHLLIVEDEDVVRAYLQRALSVHHRVDAVSDGIEALRVFASGSYDVVLVDLGMPVMPGDQVVERMLKISPQISTILITGWQLPKDDPRRRNFDFLLQKPFESIDKVLSVVAQAIRTRDSRQAEKT